MRTRLINGVCAVAMISMMLALAACVADTMNVSTGGPNRPPFMPLVTVPADMAGGVEAQWVATVQSGSGTAPYTYLWYFGGGADPDTSTESSPLVTMINESKTDDVNYTYTLTVTDSQGWMETAAGSYTVGPTQNHPPVIESAVYSGGVLTVTVSDPDDGETLTVSVTSVQGLTVDSNDKTAAATGPLTVVFHFTPDDLIAGASGTLTVEVSDGHASATEEVVVNVPPILLEADTLYAIPLSTTAVVSTPDSDDGKVTIVIAQGTPANLFQYMNGCGVVVPGQWDDTVTPAEFDPDAGAYYDRGSFDVGAVDDTADLGVVSLVDGIWATMAPPGGFLLAPDVFIQGTNLDADTVRIDFNITPIGGSDLTGASASGILFNFKLGFGMAGTYPIRFEQFNGVNRTFYSDSTSTLYFWGDITNQHDGVPDTVVVTE